MNTVKLSIIIPCYNCSKTLAEAVDSVFQQNFNYPFEIIMVDDGSTDKTRDIFIELSEKYSEIKYHFHEKNIGGGTTRNTAVEKSSGELIFCLDSDDILSPNMLPKMVSYLEEKKCDAVGISKSIKFNKKNINDVVYITNFSYSGEKIPFESLLDTNNKCSLYSTFLHTRESFNVIGGYPTSHGFDTQGFAFRFLANGFTAYTCPDTTYYHRVNFNRSYYTRENESGLTSHNWFKILEEFLFIFNNQTKEDILKFNLNNPKKNIKNFVNNIKTPYIHDYNKVLAPNIKSEYKNKILNTTSNNTYDLYWLGSYFHEQKDFQNAIKFFTEAITRKLNNPHVYFKIIDCLAKINDSNYTNTINKIKELYNYKFLGSKLSFHKRVVNKIKKIMKYE